MAFPESPKLCTTLLTKCYLKKRPKRIWKVLKRTGQRTWCCQRYDRYLHRSFPKDKFIVEDDNSRDTVWWTSDEYKNDNHKATPEAWKAVKDIALKELSNKRLFVVDAFCGANKDTRMAIRFIVEVAWQAHFVTNMFIKPTAEELENFEPDFVVYNASKAKKLKTTKN